MCILEQSVSLMCLNCAQNVYTMLCTTGSLHSMERPTLHLRVCWLNQCVLLYVHSQTDNGDHRDRSWCAAFVTLSVFLPDVSVCLSFGVHIKNVCSGTGLTGHWQPIFNPHQPNPTMSYIPSPSPTPPVSSQRISPGLNFFPEFMLPESRCLVTIKEQWWLCGCLYVCCVCITNAPLARTTRNQVRSLFFSAKHPCNLRVMLN